LEDDDKDTHTLILNLTPTHRHVSTFYVKPTSFLATSVRSGGIGVSIPKLSDKLIVMSISMVSQMHVVGEFALLQNH
jgi:hypothetical protein